MTEILKNPKQIAAFDDLTRFKFLLCGRRGGKTYLLTESICSKVPTLPPFGEILYCAPSHAQAKEIIWDILEKRLFELGWNYRSLPSKNRFELSKKRKIYVMGVEKIARMRGHALDEAYLDEVGFYGPSLNDVWRVIRPALADRRGGATLATTPNGKGTDAHAFYLESLEKEDWAYHHWTTVDNPYISRIEIEDAKRELDERSYRQEFEASWESFEGLAYYSFDESLHVKKQPAVDVNLPLILAFDFNVNPTSLLLIQYDGIMRVKKEYSLKHSSTEQTVIDFCADFAMHAANVKLLIRGDAAGSARKSNTGRSDYEYVCEILTAQGFRWEKQVLSHNPAIVDRLKKVNSWLKPFDAMPRVEIDCACKELIKDLSSQEINGRIPSDKGNLGHKVDALGYAIYYQDRVQRITPAATRIL